MGIPWKDLLKDAKAMNEKLYNQLPQHAEELQLPHLTRAQNKDFDFSIDQCPHPVGNYFWLLVREDLLSTYCFIIV